LGDRREERFIKEEMNSFCMGLNLKASSDDEAIEVKHLRKNFAVLIK
jgi:hypothetical protein